MYLIESVLVLNEAKVSGAEVERRPNLRKDQGFESRDERVLSLGFVHKNGASMG